MGRSDSKRKAKKGRRRRAGPGARKAMVAALLGDPERRALIGTAPDATLAEAWGEVEAVVRLARYELGLFFPAGRSSRGRGTAKPRSPNSGKGARIRADLEKMELLGAAPDADLAGRWGIRESTVAKLRRERGIPRYLSTDSPTERPPRPISDFLVGDEARIARLGKEQDAALAEEWGVSHVAIHRARVRRGIPAAGRRTAASKPDLIAALGTAKDADIAARFGYSEGKIEALRRERRIPAFSSLSEAPPWTVNVGVLRDKALAEKWGIPVTTISSYRYRRGMSLPPDPRRDPDHAALSKRCYDFAAEQAAAGLFTDWRAVAARSGASDRVRAATLARAYALRRRLPWPLGPRHGLPAALAERAYRMRAADSALSWQKIAAALGVDGPRAAGQVSRAAGTYAKRRGLPWPLLGER